MSEAKDLGTLHMSRDSFIRIKTPDHKRTYMVTLGQSGHLNFLMTSSADHSGKALVTINPEEKEPGA